MFTSLSLSLSLSLMADYGHDVTSAEGARRHLRSIGGASPLRLAPIADARDYGRIVRRLHRRREIDHPLAAQPQPLWPHEEPPPTASSYVDGRLLAAGYCLSPPTRWAAELPAWLDYWCGAMPRPTIINSCFNLLAPAAVAIARRIGCPAWVLRVAQRSEELQLLRPLQLDDRAALIASTDVATRRRGTRRIPQRMVTRLRRAARALGRTSRGLAAGAAGYSLRWGAAKSSGLAAANHGRAPRILRPLCLAAWAALGRVSHEVQRAILEHLAAHPPQGFGPIRVRDLPWAEGARAARDCARSSAARAAWATGKRQSSLASDDRW